MTSLPPRIRPILALLLLGITQAATGGSAAPTPPVYRPPGRPSAAPKVTYVDDTVVVARVNDKVIRVRDYVERYFNSYREFRPSTDSTGRAEFLKRLIEKEVVSDVARKANRPETFEDRATMRAHVQRTLGNALFEHAVLDSVRVHESEAESIYVQMKRELHLARIRFGSRETAARMRRDLVAGRLSWTSAWNLRLRIPGDASVSPDMGWQNRMNAPPTMTSLFRLPVGGISEPIPDPPGFALYQVKEERPFKLHEFRMYRSVIMEQLRAEKTDLYRERLVSGLRKSVGLKLDSATVAWAAKRYPQKLTGEGTSRVTLDTTIPVFSPEDTGRVIARYQGGTITVGRLVESYRAIPELLRPSLDTPEGIRAQVDLLVLEPRFAQIARQRGYDRDSTVQVLIERRREELMAEHLFQDSVQAKIFVPPAERRKYYQENQHRFVSAPIARYVAFYVESQGERDSLADQLRRGVRPEDIIRADSIAGRPRGQVAQKQRDDQNLPFPQVFGDMKVGDILFVGPNKEGAYNVLKLLARDSGHPVPFEEADAQIDEYLQQEAADRKLAEFIDRHEVGMRIESHPELLMKINLQAPLEPWEARAENAQR